MFNLTRFLKGFSSKTHWNTRIKKYIKEAKKLEEFDKGKNFYSCAVESAIGFVDSLRGFDEALKLEILNDLYQRRVLELKSELVNVPVATVKASKSLESDHFNIYGVSSIEELAQKIINDIKFVGNNKISYFYDNEKIIEPKEIKDIFIDYVYFFTYFYKYNSIRTHLKTIRKAIVDSDLSPDEKKTAVREFRLSNKIHTFLNEGGKQTRVKNMTEVLEPIEIPFINDFISKGKKFINKDISRQDKKLAFTYLAVSVSLSVGRRLSDIITHSEISKLGSYKVKIVGVAKKRESDDSKPFELIAPTLFLSADEVIKAIAKLKSMIPATLRTVMTQDKFAHNLADFKLIDKRLWVKGSKFDSTRAIYAIVSELIYNQNNIIEENRKPQATYIQQILGHGSEDFGTYQHYYKRQVLLKDFNLKEYLALTKTAMM